MGKSKVRKLLKDYHTLCELEAFDLIDPETFEEGKREIRKKLGLLALEASDLNEVKPRTVCHWFGDNEVKVRRVKKVPRSLDRLFGYLFDYNKLNKLSEKDLSLLRDFIMYSWGEDNE